jgi:hypothetical protein
MFNSQNPNSKGLYGRRIIIRLALNHACTSKIGLKSSLEKTKVDDI